MNDIFVNELKKEYLELYLLTLQEAWYDQSNHSQDDIQSARVTTQKETGQEEKIRLVL